MDFISHYAESAKTALGFFWKAGWAFVLGYFVKGMIQAFVPKGKLTKYMGENDLKSISLSTFFREASSSCSFAALAVARTLIKKVSSLCSGCGIYVCLYPIILNFN